jgi:hypothetical protein
MLEFTVSSPNTFRLSDLTIRGSAPDPYICQPGHLKLSGTSKAFRIDHVQFENQQTVGIRTWGELWGVIDHNVFQANGKQGIIVDHGGWAGQLNGDGSWAAPSNFGSQEFVFIEDNTFNDPNPVGKGAIDVFGGGRVVFRHNTASFLASHGTESTGRRRGIRAFEIYDNTFTATQNSQYTAIFIRGGTGVIHDNTFVATSPNSYSSIATFENDRTKDSFSPWGVCDGTSLFDHNDAVIYAAGVHTGPDGAVGVLTDLTKDFTSACLGASCAGNGFSIRNTTKGWGSSIASTTTTTITNNGSAFGQNRTWSIGDAYQILRASACIDQVGRGQGTLLSGTPPTPTVWPAQTAEPVYLWGNQVVGAAQSAVRTNSIHVKADREFLNNIVKPGYVPFTYPHPLTTTGPAPSAPTNLRVLPTP